MKRSKKIFFLFSALFLLALAYIGYDISSRTVSPAAAFKERLEQDTLSRNLKLDSLELLK